MIILDMKMNRIIITMIDTIMVGIIQMDTISIGEGIIDMVVIIIADIDITITIERIDEQEEAIDILDEVIIQEIIVITGIENIEIDIIKEIEKEHIEGLIVIIETVIESIIEDKFNILGRKGEVT